MKAIFVGQDGIGAELRRLRKSKGIRGQDIAKRMKVNPSTITILEKNTGTVRNFETIVKYCEQLGVSIFFTVTMNEDDMNRLTDYTKYEKAKR